MYKYCEIFTITINTKRRAFFYKKKQTQARDVKGKTAQIKSTHNDTHIMKISEIEIRSTFITQLLALARNRKTAANNNESHNLQINVSRQ